ncbi:methyltransferase domain-containing protein [Ornithinimicrobium sp. F0845]|uniref:class I SAM-dependent methyltransferase n=1 Tax=Ornithinimicrobium sp. F0845 TaxID=2926412 RepID=UPI001FF26816|nr:class I SAM-dependent methyltransferase [Ornithinimicrobium sp. F0845]MCK0111655.1 methyltransferase domain-containing protein [Ornithinimicrobium sp. F0845]
MPDAEFDDPRLAPLYDILDPDRSDLDTYLAVAEEIGARSVLDVGCGTGTFAILLAQRGIEVTGLDPAGASLDVARGKEGAEQVAWVHGDATTLPPLQVDLATMTANVAQVFLTDEAWARTLSAIHAALRPGGHLAFETRVPADRGWERWTPERTRATTDVPGLGPLTEWMEVTDVREDPLLVSFTAHNEFPDGQDVVSTSTLRFRSAEELETSLAAAGFEDVVLGDLPYAPGRGWLVRARRP